MTSRRTYCEFGSLFEQASQAFNECIDMIMRKDAFMRVDEPRIPNHIKTYIENVKTYFQEGKRKLGFLIIDKDDYALIIALTPFIIGCNKMLVVSNSSKQMMDIEASIIGSNERQSLYVSTGIFDDDIKRFYTPSVMLVRPETAYMLHGYNIYNASARNIELNDKYSLYNEDIINLGTYELNEFNIDLLMINDICYENEHYNLEHLFDKTIYITHDINSIPSPEQLICDLRKKS